MSSPLDFSAELSNQLQQAAAKMKAMRTPKDAAPQKTALPDATPTVSADDGVAHHAAPTSQGMTAEAAHPQEAQAADTRASSPTKLPAPPDSAADAPQPASATAAAPQRTHGAKRTAAPKKTHRTASAPLPQSGQQIATTVTATITNSTATDTNIKENTNDNSKQPESQSHELSHSTVPPTTETLPPTLSAATWSGGVKGTLLTALRELAAGQDTVQVNLKRLAEYTHIPYGSVRNAMSKLVQCGDIATQQIRMADGHGVRVRLLSAVGQEGRAGAPAQPLTTSPAPPLHTRGVYASMPCSFAVPLPTAGTTAEAAAKPDFWQTREEIFALAWPYVAQAGLTMQRLRQLQEVYAAQGFDPASLPENLRAYDRYLETHEDSDTQQGAEDFVRALQRSGRWTPPSAT